MVAQLAKDVIDFAESFCRVPEGTYVGQPLRLRDWQKQIIEQIYVPGVRRAIISMGRKNGKTFMVSLLTLAHLCGPAHRRNSQIFSAAQSRDQASLVFGLAAKMVRMSPRLNTLITVRESRKELFSSNSGAVYRALSADASTAYGLSPAFIVHDELGQVRGPKSELYEALETATGAHENPLSVIISTQAPSDNDLLSMLIEAAPLDPKTALVLHTSSMDADPFAEETIKAANPAYGDFLNAVEVADMARVAEAMPSREAEYRNLILNQRVQAENPFISHAAWSACGAAPVPIEDVPVYGALDLAATTDLTCLILAGKVDDVWQVYPHFWLPADGLAERSRRDRVEYDRFARDGLLHTVPGNVIDYDFVAMFLREQFDKYDICKIAFDRWNFAHFNRSLLRAGFTEGEIALRFVEMGQGFQSMSPALRALEAVALAKQLAHGNHPLLGMCAANSVVQMDAAGNRKLTKAKSHGRIDGMQALAMTFGVVPLQDEEPEYQFFVIDPNKRETQRWQ